MRKYLLASQDLSCWLEVQNSLESPGGVLLGTNPKIRQPTVIYENVNIGKNLETGHYVLIRENTKIGDNARIGSYSELDGDLTIGDNFQCHSRCHISKYVLIGDNVRFMFNVTTLNDQYPPSGSYSAPFIGDDVLVASHVKLMPGSVVESRSFIPANTVVRGLWRSNRDAYDRLLRMKK